MPPHPSSSSRPLLRHSVSQRGMALLLVLTMVVLMSILVVGMLVSARQEVATSKVYATGSDIRLLGDSAVNLVMAQIGDATASAEKDGKPLAWISQPGLIRTFTPSGQSQAYKLFSSYEMVEGGGYDPGAAATLQKEVPADWYRKPDEFVDLNRPIELHTRNASRRVYPIADPAAADRDSAGRPLVEGFTFDASARRAPATVDPLSNPLPMPVRWIYITPDGKLVGANDPQRAEATARIAFWTDDETCKVNLNTACGGVFYDTPVANTREDHLLGRTQPIAQEYQRWPGHPSTTSLAPVLRPLRSIADPAERFRTAAMLAPRIGWGGSEGGTKYAWMTRNLGQTDVNRLFASVDEFAFDQSMNADQRVSYVVGGEELEGSDPQLDRLRFFVTPHSRAPELNLFSRPRITMWPFNREMVAPNADSGEAAKLTPEDRLIRLASEFGGRNPDGSLDYTRRQRFYFQRVSAWDPTADWHLDDNEKIYRYLQAMTAKEIPSADPTRAGGRTFASKYDAGNRDQILVNIWDYIRSQINTVNQAYQPVGFSPYSFPQGHTTEMAGYNDVAPLVAEDGAARIKGLGRHPVVSEVIFQFINAGESFELDEASTASPKPPLDRHSNADPAVKTPDGIPDYVVRKVRMVALLHFQLPVNHLLRSVPRLQIVMRRLDRPFNFVTSPTAPVPGMPSDLNAGLPQPIEVRSGPGGIAAWSTTLRDFGTGSGPGIGFPATAGNSAFRDTCYVSAFNMGYGVPDNLLYGSMGIAYPLRVPKRNDAATENLSGHSTTTTFKVLANRQALEPQDLAWRAAVTGAPGFSSREDIYYPFVSDTVEFRLPQSADAASKSVPTPSNDPSGGVDFFEVLWQGGPIELAIYPGLRDDATAFSPIAANWQPQTTTSYLMKTVLNVGDAVIPLPRKGPSDKNVVSGAPDWEAGALPKFGDLVDYYVRSKFNYTDYLMNVPRKAGSPTIAPGHTTQMDVFRGYNLTGGSPLHGDLRIAALQRDIPTSWWEEHPRYTTRGAFHACQYLPDGMQTAVKVADLENIELQPRAGDAADSSPDSARRKQGRIHPTVSQYTFFTRRTASPTTDGARRVGSAVGDFTLGYGGLAQFGALVLGPDNGSVVLASGDLTSENASSPYFYTGGAVSRAGEDDATGGTHNFHKNLTGVMHSPFKQAPSPVLFGTLPSRGASNGSWETLLFNPHPSGGRSSHRGWDAPRDHFLLDLFYMPVAEPYAITENLSTAGKINLNYQIAPFSYIKRKTGMHALLDGMTRSGQASWGTTATGGSALVSIPQADASANAFRAYSDSKLVAAAAKSYRKFVDTDATLTLFDNRLDALNDPFVSASEISEMPLVPEGVAPGAVDSFWDAAALTGDDKREMPYNHLYPRVTTRSNTFRVHFWAQALRPRPFPESPVVTGEYRGSTVIERYIDQEAAYASGSTDIFPPMNGLYKFRKVEHQHFSP